MSTNSNQGTALVTGASTGIGAAYADRLARRGHDLILVARQADRLQATADRVAAATGRRVQAVAADLGTAAGAHRVEAILRSDPTITVLVNNAGAGSTAPLLESDLDRMDQMIALNVGALTRLALTAASQFAARGAGTIINIASVVAIQPELLNGVYGASKAYVLALSQSLRHELADKGVRIQAVLPGATATEFWALSGTPVEHLPQAIVMSAADMVDAALAGLDQGEFATVPSLPELKDWENYEAARQALFPNLSRATPARRYLQSAAS